MRRPRVELLVVLLLHGFGALTWFGFTGFIYDATDRQFYGFLGIGAATWLVAALLIAWLWRSVRWPLFWFIPFAWWYPSWLLAFAVAYGWNDPV